jgi:hypothetical protein
LYAPNRISWDKSGVVSIDNNLVPGSNIIDLVNEVVRKRSTSKNPIGLQNFKLFLQEINIPKELISFQFGSGNTFYNKKKLNQYKAVASNKIHKVKSKSAILLKKKSKSPARKSNFFKKYIEYKL